MEPFEDKIRRQPSDAELRAWWEEEQKMQEFYETPLGRSMRNATCLAYSQWREHQIYQKQILEQYERYPIAQPISPPKP